MPMKNGKYVHVEPWGEEDWEFEEHLVDHLKEFSGLVKQLRGGATGEDKNAAVNRYDVLLRRLRHHGRHIGDDE